MVPFYSIQMEIERDLAVMTLMSDKKRLWYIAGAHMAQAIDEHFGRESLVETVREGPRSFFERYNSLPCC